MSLPIVLGRAARAEFDAAADWYEQRRSGLGEAFTTAVRQVLLRIADQLRFYAKVLGEVREAPVSDYPYCVYYKEEEEQVFVVAVFHTPRDPSVWQQRI